MSQVGGKYDPARAYMLTRVAQPESRNRFVGVLRPEKGFLPADPIPIVPGTEELLIGRQEALGVSLKDDWVSRRHARIRRTGDDEFILEDLGSSNGTYVDGVPIVSCVLRAGDWIQIGRNLFRFEVQLDSASGTGDVTTWLE